MDPNTITLIVSALAIGTSAAASRAVKDSYNTLKKLIQNKFGDVPDFKLVLIKYEEEPEVWKAPLRYELTKVHADLDEEIVKAAREVITLAKPQQQSTRERVVATTDTTLNLLNQFYHLSLKQAKRWVSLSLAAASLGVLFLVGGVIVTLVGRTSIGLITLGVGLISEIVSLLFFSQVRRTNKLVDDLQAKLLEAQKIRLAIDLASVTNAETQNQLEMAIQNRADQLSQEIEKSLSVN